MNAPFFVAWIRRRDATRRIIEVRMWAARWPVIADQLRQMRAAS